MEALMADDNDKQQTEPLAWDRVGQFLQDMAVVGENIAKRNQEVWGRVSSNLRGDRYPPDAMTTDAAKAMSAAMDNLEDVWTLLTRPPERDRVASVVATVFLRFTRLKGTWNVQDPVWIRVPYWSRGDMPPEATIYLDGDKEGAKALEDCISVRLADKSYLLEVADVQDLVPGVYVGVVTADDRPLANLRIVVEDPGEAA
jgi:hypothetical protein